VGDDASGDGGSGAEGAFHVAGETDAGEFAGEVEFADAFVESGGDGGDLAWCEEGIAGKGVGVAGPIHEAGGGDVVGVGGVEAGEFGFAVGVAVDGGAGAELLGGGATGEDGEFGAGVAGLVGSAFPGHGEIAVGEAVGGEFGVDPEAAFDGGEIFDGRGPSGVWGCRGGGG
jgi:hypothetical protein